MRDIGHLVVQAADGAGLPIWRNAWQGAPGAESPPPVYAIFTIKEAPGRSADNKLRSWRYWVYLFIYGEGDLRELSSQFVQNMLGAGFLLIDREDRYDRMGASSMDVTSWHMEVFDGG